MRKPAAMQPNHGVRDEKEEYDTPPRPAGQKGKNVRPESLINDGKAPAVQRHPIYFVFPHPFPIFAEAGTAQGQPPAENAR